MSPETISWLPKSSSDLASWLQAVGAIAAILFAYILGKHQASMALENSRQLQADLNKEKQRLFLALAEIATQRAIAIGKIFDDSPLDFARLHNEYHETVVNSQVGVLTTIPVHELGSAKAGAALVDLRDQLVFLRAAIERWLTNRSDSQIVIQGTLPAYDAAGSRNVQTHVQAIKRHFETMKNALDNSPTL